jgi:hypothetical protein
MSVEAMSWALDQPVSGTKKVVLIGIASHADKFGDNAWPSISTLAGYAYVSDRAVQSAISDLIEAGFVVRSLNDGGSKKVPDHLRPNLYRLNMTSKAPVKPASPRVVNKPASGEDSFITAGEESFTPPGEAGFTQTVHSEPSCEPSGCSGVSGELLPAVAGAEKPALDSEQEYRRSIWVAYATAYFNKYGAAPIRNKTVNAKLKAFSERLPHDEAPLVAEFFLSHNGKFYVEQMHDFGLLLKDAEKLRTEWITGRKMTQTKAKQEDKTGAMMSAVQELMHENGIEVAA